MTSSSILSHAVSLFNTNVALKFVLPQALKLGPVRKKKISL